VIDLGRAVARAGLVVAAGGNIAARITYDRMCVTPGGWSLADLSAANLVQVSLGGRRLEGAHAPTSELLLHLAALRARPGGRSLVGVRHQVHDEPDPDWLLRDQVLEGLAAVAGAGLVYDLLVRERELPAARVVAERLPDLTLVVDHLAKPRIREGAMEPWTGGLAALARHPNVACKVSGLVTEADWTAWTPAQLVPYVAHAAEVFGPERLLFGSDWPVCLLAAGYGEVVAASVETLERAGVGPAERDLVLGANARRLYRLP